MSPARRVWSSHRNVFPPEKPTPSATHAPPEPPAPEPAGVTVEEGSPQWQAYEMLIQKIESMYAPLAKIHRRLDREHMRGKRFSEILGRVFELYDIPPAYAGLVVRSYPGYEAHDEETQNLREFLKQWMKRRHDFRPQPGLGASFDMDQDSLFGR